MVSVGTMKQTVTLLKQVKLDGVWKRYPVVLNRNGSIKPDHVLVAKPTHASEGNYILDWYEGGKRMRKSVGKDAADAINQRDRKVAELTAASNGLTVTNGDPTKRLVSDADEEYLADIEAHKSSKTLAAYRTAITYFRESCKKTYVEDITRRDLLAFKTYLADEKEQSDRSVWNKFSAVMGFLKSVGHTGKNIGVVKHDWPEYDEETPEVYEDDELVKFYAACDEDEARWFRFFELTGMREGEVQHCQWSWIDMSKRTITVQPNKRLGWRPKKNKTRSIPMSAPLVDLLKDWRKKTAESTCDLVFPTAGCNIKLDFLDCLKAIAKLAKLFCKKCDGCAQETPNCERWFLHKFRSSFATKVVRKADLRTAMEWLGHTDTASTLRYLRPAEGKEAQAKMDAVFS
jgi:integrase